MDERNRDDFSEENHVNMTGEPADHEKNINEAGQDAQGPSAGEEGPDVAAPVPDTSNAMQLDAADTGEDPYSTSGQPEDPQQAAGSAENADSHRQQSYWQGGYSYQNPNPYQNYNHYNAYPYQAAKPAKNKSNRPFIIVAASAGLLMLLCCVVIVVAQVMGIGSAAEFPGSEDQGGAVIEQPDKSNEGNAQREEGTIYNVPEITTSKKNGEELTIVEINKKVKNSVVGILVSAQNEEEPYFSGSGFIISNDGYIITNEHVVDKATQVQVVLSDGITEYNAKIVGEDIQSDLAILKIEANDLSPAELGDSDELEVGETVVAIGNPYGMELAGTVTDGIVSALNRKIEINGSFMTLIQTNASINPGNSGGPLVNAYGQVVGITSSKLVATDYEGIGFAIPINDVTSITEELINYGYIKTRAYIGIQGSGLTESYAKYHNLPRGVYVSYVDPNCDAAKKGLQKDDIIVGFNGEKIVSMAELNAAKDAFRPGDQVTITVWRENEEFDLQITLTEAS